MNRKSGDALELRRLLSKPALTPPETKRVKVLMTQVADEGDQLNRDIAATKVSNRKSSDALELSQLLSKPALTHHETERVKVLMPQVAKEEEEKMNVTTQQGAATKVPTSRFRIGWGRNRSHLSSEEKKKSEIEPDISLEKVKELEAILDTAMVSEFRHCECELFVETSPPRAKCGRPAAISSKDDDMCWVCKYLQTLTQTNNSIKKTSKQQSAPHGRETTTEKVERLRRTLETAMVSESATCESTLFGRSSGLKCGKPAAFSIDSSGHLVHTQLCWQCKVVSGICAACVDFDQIGDK